MNDILPGSRDHISTFKEWKHGTKNWFTANNSNGQNCDIIKFAYYSVSYKIKYSSISTHSNPLKFCDQKVASEVQSILAGFWFLWQHSWSRPLLLKITIVHFYFSDRRKMTFESLKW